MPVSNNIEDILRDLSKPLALFLQSHLPAIRKDWWESCVLNKLPEELTKILSLDDLKSLNTAELLTIFDDNWNELTEVAHLEHILRNYIKEILTVISNINQEKAKIIENTDDFEYYLNIIKRLSLEISAPADYVDKVNQILQEIAINKYGQPIDDKSPVDSLKKTILSDPVFKVGDLICLSARPEEIAPVLEVNTNGEETRYTVFLNSRKQQWYQSQIQQVDDVSNENSVSLKEFNAYLTATYIKNPGIDTLYSLNSANIEIIPHQFRPVLKFIRSDQPRMLIADGVGVGKTIEAGLILKELEARNDCKNVLIICPKSLVIERKWQDEMKAKFRESFEPLDGEKLRNAVLDADLYEWDFTKYGKVIIPFSLLTDNNLEKKRTYPGLLNLSTPPCFDLVIVDEAHHIRNSNTLANKAVRFFVDNAEAAIFLTATPIQMGDSDLYSLLRILRPDLIPDYATFRVIAEPNKYINQALSEIREEKPDWKNRAVTQLKYAAATEWGGLEYPSNPIFVKVMEILRKSTISEEERISLLSDVEMLHTFSKIINRTRRRDIDNCYATRKSMTCPAPFTSEQKEFYDELIRVQRSIFEIVSPNTPTGFIISSLQRRAASCLPGLIPYLHSILNKSLSREDCLEIDLESLSDIEYSKIEQKIDRLLKMSAKIPQVDYKYDKLLEIIQEKNKGNPNKVMVFSTFRHTLAYIYNRLTADGIRVGLIHGGVKDEDRRYLRRKFSLPKDKEGAIDVLLFSEVGNEGLDYQFCDCMVNYDIPWNPMRIEQRIGRIDRTGQKSETLSIFNLVVPETVDAVIYDRCLLRIGVFEESIGGSEEILGDIAKEIQEIGENFRLSEREKELRLNQLADNEIRKYIESNKLEEGRAELFGINLNGKQMEKEITDATNYWLSPDSLENLVKVYLQNRLNMNAEFIVSSNGRKKLKIGTNNRKLLLNDYISLKIKQKNNKWKLWLEGKNTGLLENELSFYYPVSFEATSLDDSDPDLISTVHPLTKQAVSFLSSNTNISTSITIKDDNIPRGRYPFAIYLWKKTGVISNQQLIPVSDNREVMGRLFSYLKNGKDTSIPEIIGDDEKMKLEHIQYNLWKTEREAHIAKTKEIIETRKNSIRKSSQGRINLIQCYLNSVTNQKIYQMKRDQLKNEENKLTNYLLSLDEELFKADIETSLVGYGVVVIEK